MHEERWDEWLVAEHELIERAMAVMEHELERLVPGTQAGLPLSRAVDFLLEFGDRLHNTKEERFLFPLMEERGIPARGGPIGVMLAEHEAERELLTGLLEALPRVHELEPTELQELVRSGQEYLRVRAAHIWKENDVLYAMGRRVLSEDDGQGLVERFAALDAEHYGEDARAAYTWMVEELEEGGRGVSSLVHGLSYAQIDAILEALPVEVTFVDADDTVAYFNRLDRDKIFVRTRSVVGRKVDRCHPAKSVDRVMEIVEGFRAGTLDQADFWIDFRGDKVLIRYFPVRDREGAYLGVLEVTQSIGWIQRLEGQKTLLHE